MMNTYMMNIRSLKGVYVSAIMEMLNLGIALVNFSPESINISVNTNRIQNR